MSDRPFGRSAVPAPAEPAFPTDDAARGMAELWYSEHLAQHLSPDHGMAAKRCAAFLLGEGVEAHRAQTIALQALGWIEHGDGGAFVDTDRTTSYAVFLVDPVTGREFAITAEALAQHARCTIDCAPHVAVHRPTRPGAQA